MKSIRQAWKHIRRLFYKSRRIRNENYFRKHFPHCQIHWTVRLPKIGKIEIGQSTMIMRNAHMLSWHPDDAIIIGKYSGVGIDSIIINGHGHDLTRASTFAFKRRVVDGIIYPQRNEGVTTTIGHDAYVPTRILILGPLTIGHGAVVASGAVVTKDVPPYAIVAGVPAKIIGYRATPEQIEKLLKIAWWDWPLDIIKERIDDLDSPLDAFVEKYSTS